MKLVHLTRGYSAKVDDEDFNFVSQWKWYAQVNQKGVYAARRECRGGKLIYMHRLINSTLEGLVTDHIDGDGLNNTRANLRAATRLENSRNQRPAKGGTSHLKGAWLDRTSHNRKKWRSAIRVSGRLKYLGRFETEEEAAAAYAAAALVEFGQFART